MREVARLQLDYYQKKIYKIRFTSERVVGLLAELLVLIIQPYPLLNDYTFEMTEVFNGYRYPFKLNYVLTLLSLLRMYTLARSHLLTTPYMSPRSHRITRMYLCRADYLHALKCIFKDYPNQLVGTYFFVSILFFSFALRVSERPLARIPEAALYQFEYLTNSMWYMITTMATVGYGDLYPHTSIGRWICNLLILWSIVIVSIMVVVMNNTFEMEQSTPCVTQRKSRSCRC